MYLKYFCILRKYIEQEDYMGEEKIYPLRQNVYLNIKFKRPYEFG